MICILFPARQMTFLCKLFYILMSIFPVHSFHIPVMGLAYTIDTPLKVARFGISSVVSIVADNLPEDMRRFYCHQQSEEFVPIHEGDADFRARRITAYLDLLHRILAKQMAQLRAEPFEDGREIVKYFELLPPASPIRNLYNQMRGLEEGEAKKSLQEILRRKMIAGSIDVNIMTKCDKVNYDKKGEVLPAEFNDAMAALRGFANSQLQSAVVFSAGLNPRLYSYCETFADFFPVEKGNTQKKIILKVSDFRSALIQGKFFAQKGLWVSEFRIESGLNCGGHAFATDGYLLAPILEEFKQKKDEMGAELFGLCNAALLKKGVATYLQQPIIKISVQGGIGTANENNFLLEYYHVSSTGWGSPFLLVPEATNVDDHTLNQLATAKKDDYYLSNASPLGVPFNNLRNSSAGEERLTKIASGKPGSACYNKYLSFNTEFTEKPICTASRQYQHLKIKQLNDGDATGEVLQMQINKVTEKECLCTGLCNAAFLKNGITPPHKASAVSICPGPNLAYFSGTFSLRDMIDHIYGRKNILNQVHRPNMFINELNLYVDYLEKEISNSVGIITGKQVKYLHKFKDNLVSGMEYYKTLADKMIRETEQFRNNFIEELHTINQYVSNLRLPEQPVTTNPVMSVA